LGLLFGVLTIAAARDPAYYESPEFARDDYYSEDGQASGEWVGREAAALGLVGAPDRGDLEALLAGSHPGDGSPLSGRRSTSNAGFDLTFTAPKSVSVLAGVGDPQLRVAVVAAHEAGVAAGLNYLERHECRARRGAGGQRVIGARGFVGAAFTHELSRSGDPHLHTHVVIANVVLGEDGRYSAPDMRRVFAAAKTAGTIAEAVMRRELSRSLGVEWAQARNGTADLARMPEQVVAEFSTRRAEISEVADERGVSGLRSVGAVQRETRDRKREVDRDEAVAGWRARAGEHGFGRAELDALLRGRQTAREAPLRDDLFAHLAGPRGLTERDSTFDRRAVLRAVAEAHRDGIDLAKLERLADAFIAEHGVVVEQGEPTGGARERYSVADMLDTERRLLDIADQRTAHARVGERTAERLLDERPWLGADQQRAVRGLVSGQDRIALVEARAGRGKTTTLAAVNDALLRSGVSVAGTAWQGEAARTLHAEAGIPAETAARLLSRLRTGSERPPPGAVLVVDEASTMPTRALTELAEAVAAVDGRLILVGDRAQLPAIDAGGAFASLADRLGAVELTENRRQRDPVQARVADLLGDGRVDEALRWLERSGGLQAYRDSDAARATLLEEWAQVAIASNDPSRTLILAHDRADVDALNREARELMERSGRLGPTRLVASGVEWAAGDRLVCRRNNYRPEIDVRNGTRGTVEAVARDRGALVLRTDDGRRIELPADYLEHARHGYAITGHASQGATVDRTFVLASGDRGSAEWGYVVGSRHRIDLQVFVAGGDRDFARDELARAWGRAQTKGLAVDRLDPAARAERTVGRVRMGREAARDQDPVRGIELG
jgi:conjugative relaxase-like TrwC/TraI family protein